MIKTAARKDFVKHTLPVWIDLTPPEIAYAQTKQPNGREIYTISMKDTLSGLDPTSIIFPKDLSQMLLLDQKINKKKAVFKYEVLPEPMIVQDGPAPFQVQSLRFPFSIQQTVPEVSEQEYETGAFDLAGIPSFILAKITIPSYRTRLDPGGNAKESCQSTRPSGNQRITFTGSTKLARVYDFDKNGPDLTFVFRYTTPVGISQYDMNNDSTKVTNALKLNLTDKESEIRNKIPSFTNETATLENMEANLKLDAASFRIGGDSRTIILGNPTKYPQLYSLITTLDTKYKSEHLKQNGYHIVSVDLTNLYNKTYSNQENIYLTIHIGREKTDVRLKFNKEENRWEVWC